MPMPKEEFSRREQYYAAIAGRNGVKPAFPFSREEQYLEAIDEYLDTKANLVNGKVPASELPSYVDDVLEFADKEHFPIPGELGKIYVALDTNKTYRWSGSTYIQVGGGDAPTIATIDISDNEDEFTEAQMEDIFTNKYDVLRLITSGGVNNAYKAVGSMEDIDVVAYISYPPNVGGFVALTFYYDSETSRYSMEINMATEQVSGTDDGTNWTSITIGDTTKNIPAGGAPQLIATKIVDDNDDPYNPILNFPSITELQPGHYYMTTKTNWAEGMVSGVVEFTVFDRIQGGGESDQHFATGTVVYWQDGTSPSPTGTVYDNYADCVFEISQDDDVWSLWITAGMNAFNDGAEIKLYYKPL